MILFLKEYIWSILFYFVIFFAILMINKNSVCKRLKISISKTITFGLFYNPSVLISIFVLTLLSALRYYVGTDYRSYLIYAKRTIEYLINTDGLELGFIKLIELFQMSGLEDIYFVSLLSLVYASIFSFFVLNDKRIMEKPMLFFAIYLFGWQYMYSLNVIRACISAVCIMICIHSLEENNYIKFFLFIVVGSIFHRTTIILALIVFIIKKFEVRYSYVLIYILALIPLFVLKDKIISFVFSLDFFQNVRYQSYLLTGYFGERNLKSLIPIFPRLILWSLICIFNINPRNKSDKFYLSLFNYNMIITMSELFLEMSWRLMLGTWIADYYVCELAFIQIKNKKNHKIFRFVICLYLLIHFIIYAYLDQGVFPYKTIFQI